MKDKTKWAFKLGVELEDRVSGFRGIVEARREFLNRCRQYLLQRKLQKPDDKPADTALWIDEQQLQQVGVGISDEAPTVEKPKGGPRESASPEGR